MVTERSISTEGGCPESYSSIPGFAKQVARAPATVSFPGLPAGKGFQIEVRLSSPKGTETLPKLDQLIATFKEHSP